MHSEHGGEAEKRPSPDAMDPGTAEAVEAAVLRRLIAHLDERKDVPFVPNEAVRFVPDPLPPEVEVLREELEPGQTILWQVEDDEETLRPVVVTLGLVGAEGTEILGDAIAVGSVVAVPATDATRSRSRRRRGLRFF